MPWGWECRARLVKQVPLKPTERRGKAPDISNPAPNQYETPQIFCGPGFDKIKRAPAYTFGHLTKADHKKPATTPNAPMFNVNGVGPKGGPFKIKHCVVSPQLDPVTDRTKTPGPAMYMPKVGIRYKRPPAYSMRLAAKPPYQPWDMWTPPSNMYHPPFFGKKEPAYTFGGVVKTLQRAEMPGPGNHDPNINYVKQRKPAYSFGGPFRQLKPQKKPPPNTYCEKKFMVSMRTIPAPTFGIRHSPYIGEQNVFLKSSKLELALNN